MSKCCEDGISQTIKYKIFSVLPIAFPLLMWRFQLMRRSMSYILPWATKKSQEAGAALNMLGALHWLYNAQKLFWRYILPGKFGVQFFDEIYHMGAHFQLSLQYGDLKWLKREVVLPGSNTRERELNQMLWLVSWFKTQMPIGCSTNNNTETKMHTHSQSLAHLISTCMHKIENNQFCFSGEEHSDMIMSVAV